MMLILPCALLVRSRMVKKVERAERDYKKIRKTVKKLQVRASLSIIEGQGNPSVASPPIS